MIISRGPIQCGVSVLFLQSALLPGFQRNIAHALACHPKGSKVLIRELADDLVDEPIWQCEESLGLH